MHLDSKIIWSAKWVSLLSKTILSFPFLTTSLLDLWVWEKKKKTDVRCLQITPGSLLPSQTQGPELLRLWRFCAISQQSSTLQTLWFVAGPQRLAHPEGGKWHQVFFHHRLAFSLLPYKLMVALLCCPLTCINGKGKSICYLYPCFSSFALIFTVCCFHHFKILFKFTWFNLIEG